MNIQPQAEVRVKRKYNKRRQYPNVRALLSALMQETRGDKAKTFEKFKEAVLNDPLHMEECIEFSFRLGYGTLTKEKMPYDEKRKRREETRQLVGQTLSDFNKHIDKVTEVKLLKMLMPNGKLLAKCSGQECTAFGGWLASVGSAIKPDELVGEKFSESELWKIKIA